MFVESVERDGKVFEVRRGSDGSGNPVFVVQQSKDGRCVAQDNFDNVEEAKNWARWA